MSKRNDPSKDELRVIPPPEVANSLAAYMDDADSSMAGMSEHRVLPRLKVVQGQSSAELKRHFQEGSVIFTPGNELIAQPGESFFLVPLFFWTDWLLWSDRDDKNNPMVQARSTDPASDLARRAKDPELRVEEYDGGPKGKPFKRRYAEALNFAAFVYGEHDQALRACALSFQRGEHFKGKTFCSSIMGRKLNGKTPPIWSQVWVLTANQRTKGTYSWYGLDHSNPVDEFRYIFDEHVASFHAEHAQLRDDFEKQRLYAATDDDDGMSDAEARTDAAADAGEKKGF